MASSKDNKRDTSCTGGDCDKAAPLTASMEVTRKLTVADGEAVVVTESISAFDFYSCEEAIKRLNEYLDSELQPVERDDVMKHLQICAPCLERFQFEKTLMIAMRERVRRSMAPLKLKERLASLMKNNGS